MLMVSRKKDESVLLQVGDVEINVKVVGYRGGQVRLGISAPQSVRILRAENRQAGDNDTLQQPRAGDAGEP